MGAFVKIRKRFVIMIVVIFAVSLTAIAVNANPQDLFSLKNGDLWQGHTLVDENVRSYQAVDANTVFVLGTDDNLWYTPAPFGQIPNPNRLQVDAHVKSYNVQDANTVYVLGYDNNLWYTPAPFGQVPNPHRRLTN